MLDEARKTTLLNNGDLAVEHVKAKESSPTKRDLAGLMMDVVRLGCAGLLVDARGLFGEVLGRLSTDMLKDGTVAEERRELRAQATRLVGRVQSEEGVKVALPVGELSGMDQAGWALKMFMDGHSR